MSSTRWARAGSRLTRPEPSSAPRSQAETDLAHRQADRGSAQSGFQTLEANYLELQAAVAGARRHLRPGRGNPPGLATASAAADARADRGPAPVSYPLAPGRTPGDEAVRAGSALIDATRLRDQDANRLQAGELTSSSM